MVGKTKQAARDPFPRWTCVLYDVLYLMRAYCTVQYGKLQGGQSALCRKLGV